jgi:hypothetical protein
MVVGTKIMNKHIDSKSTVVSSYAPMQQQHLQTENSTSMLILHWLWAPVRKFKSGMVMDGFWLEVEYQKYGGLSHIFNGYLLALIQSTV